MKKTILLLTVICTLGTGAFAQVHQDVVSEDPDGVERKTSLAVCDSSREGKVSYVKAPDTAGYSVMCVNNRGVYMLVPFAPAQGPGAIRFTWDGMQSEDYLAFETSGSATQGEATGQLGHPGIFRMHTGTTPGSFLSLIFKSNETSSSTICSFDPDAGNWSYEAIVKPETSRTNVDVHVGLSADWDNPDDGDVIYFEYDSDEATVTDATNASPIVITTLAAHSYFTGQEVVVSDVIGNTAANGTFTITNLSSTTFSLDGSTGNGAYVSGGAVIADNWTTHTASGGSSTQTDTGVTYAAGTWYRLFTRKVGASVEFYIASNGDQYSSVINHSTNIAGADQCPLVFIENNAAADNSIEIDYMMFQVLGISR